MTRRPTTERESAIVTETRAQFSALTRAVLTGEPKATKRIVIALGEHLADDNACAELVRATLDNANALQAVLTDLIWIEAGELAEVALDDREQQLHDNYVDQQIDLMKHPEAA